MKRIYLLLVQLALLISGAITHDAHAAAESGPRLTINFNREWKFRLGDVPEAPTIAHDDKDWDRVGLPHSFSMPYFAAQDFYTGYG